MIRITIYSRPGCHLCEAMKAVVERAVRGGSVAATIDEVDISQDTDLQARYGVEIPVLVVDGMKTAKYRVTEADVRRMLIARSRASGGSGGSGGSDGSGGSGGLDGSRESPPT